MTDEFNDAQNGRLTDLARIEADYLASRCAIACLFDFLAHIEADWHDERPAARARALMGFHSDFISRNLGEYLGVRSFEPGIRHHSGPAVPGPADVNHVDVMLLNDAVAVDVDEIQAWSGAPMTQQPWLDVVQPQRLREQRVVIEVDLADGQVVGGAPVSIDLTEIFLGQHV